ncbi:MAG: diaminohydroxyphosphoribosylaminopyrimidine deaminase, partial [Frankiales bacterium]|nr:diaminohydroxyphosphoribosylaminopyrimidine deaminase [Frankiales bacterium]
VPQPLRVIVDSSGRTPLTARALAGEDPAVVALTASAALRDTGYPRVLELPTGPDGHVDLAALLDRLAADHGVVSVLVEGGPVLAGAFVAAGLVDRIIGYVAPCLLGAGPAALADAGAGTIDSAHRLRLDEAVLIGGDLRLTVRPRRT